MAAGRGQACLLALSIRVLVHDTGQSHSLLGQLGLKEAMRFRDTVLPLDPENLLPSQPGLVIHAVTVGEGARWVAPLDELTPPRIKPPVSFDAWWSEPHTRDVHGREWNRQRMVLDVANTEGGAHVDPLRYEDLRQLDEENSMGWLFSDPLAGDDQSYLNGPMLPSIRQIAFELQSTLHPNVDE